MTEQFAFEQLGRNRAAVDGDERTLPPRTRIVNGPGGELLAGARFAQDQDARIVRRNLADERADLADRFGYAGRHRDVAGLFECSLSRHMQGLCERFASEWKWESDDARRTDRCNDLLGGRGRTVSHDRYIAELLAQRCAELTPIRRIACIAHQQRGGRRR